MTKYLSLEECETCFKADAYAVEEFQWTATSGASRIEFSAEKTPGSRHRGRVSDCLCP